MDIIAKYMKVNNKVYISQGNNDWCKLSIFDKRNIMKIGAAQYHSLFLEDSGTLWYSNRFKFYSEPTPIKHFKRYNIKIKDIKCGESQNLAIDYKNKIYAWSHLNLNNNDDDNIQFGNNYGPKRIEYLAKYDIKYIECGRGHSYCSTTDGRHYLFGDNHWNQCLTFDKRDIVKVNEPFCINKKINQLYGNNKLIKKLILGPHHTIVILKDKNKENKEKIKDKLQGNPIMTSNISSSSESSRRSSDKSTSSSSPSKSLTSYFF